MFVALITLRPLNMNKRSTINYNGQLLEITGWYEKEEEGCPESLTITNIVWMGTEVSQLLEDMGVDFRKLEILAIEKF